MKDGTKGYSSLKDFFKILKQEEDGKPRFNLEQKDLEILKRSIMAKEINEKLKNISHLKNHIEKIAQIDSPAEFSQSISELCKDLDNLTQMCKQVETSLQIE